MAERGDRSGLRGSLPRLDRLELERFAILLPVAALAVAVLVWPWPARWGVILDGALFGGRIALLALGIALIFRANRIVNFAQGGLGALPSTLVVILVLSVGWNYFLAVTIGLVGSIVLGIVVETLIIRRFFQSPRLILTVATIGLAQVLTFAGLILAEQFDETSFGSSNRLDPPFTVRLEVDGTIFGANDVITMAVIPIVFVALAVWLTRSDIGIAVRASAERTDRAATLGIPVKRLNTIVWTVATVLAFVAMLLRAGAVGLPLGSALPPFFLLQALAAAVIGRMERFVVIASAALGIGILDRAITFQPGNRPAYNDAILFLVVLLGLLLTRQPGAGRVDREQVSTWQAAREIRPIPRELSGLSEVRLLRYGVPLLVIGLLAAVAPLLRESRVNLLSAILIFGIIGLSLVVLTGWAGQVSLGQMAFVGVGAAVGGALTHRYDLDLSIALLGAGAVGGVVAVVIGIPALRRRGLTLAVSTLAFALLTSSYVLNRELFVHEYLPPFRIDRTKLFGVFDLTNELTFFYVTFVALGVALFLVYGLRRSRTGRVLIGIRENERAVRTYGVEAGRTALAGFAISGFLAAFAGALYVHHQTGLTNAPYAPEESLQVFSMAVIGGLGSVPGVLLGAGYVQGANYFLPGNWQLLATGAGLLLVLMILPGGIGSVFYDLRDSLLRRIAARRGLLVPSLVADRAGAQPAGDVVLERAVEATERAKVPEPAQ